MIHLKKSFPKMNFHSFYKTKHYKDKRNTLSGSSCSKALANKTKCLIINFSVFSPTGQDAITFQCPRRTLDHPIILFDSLPVQMGATASDSTDKWTLGPLSCGEEDTCTVFLNFHQFHSVRRTVGFITAAHLCPPAVAWNWKSPRNSRMEVWCASYPSSV